MRVVGASKRTRRFAAGADEARNLSRIPSPLDYLAVREELLDGELAEIDWRRDLRLAEENLKGLAA